MGSEGDLLNLGSVPKDGAWVLEDVLLNPVSVPTVGALPTDGATEAALLGPRPTELGTWVIEDALANA